MPQQYKLRLSEGTLLVVDHDALSTWVVDERAMVQPVGSHRWRSLRQFLADERDGVGTPAAYWNEPPPDRVSPDDQAGDGLGSGERRRGRKRAAANEGMFGMLSNWVDKIAKPVPRSRSTAAPRVSNTLRPLAEALTAPPTAAPPLQLASSPLELVSAPIQLPTDAEPVEVYVPPPPPAPSIVNTPLVPLEEEAAASPSEEESVEVPVEEFAALAGPRPVLDDDDPPTVPRMDLDGRIPRKLHATRPAALETFEVPAEEFAAAVAPRPEIPADYDPPTVPSMDLEGRPRSGRATAPAAAPRVAAAPSTSKRAASPALKSVAKLAAPAAAKPRKATPRAAPVAAPAPELDPDYDPPTIPRLDLEALAASTPARAKLTATPSSVPASWLSPDPPTMPRVSIDELENAFRVPASAVPPTSDARGAASIGAPVGIQAFADEPDARPRSARRPIEDDDAEPALRLKPLDPEPARSHADELAAEQYDDYETLQEPGRLENALEAVRGVVATWSHLLGQWLAVVMPSSSDAPGARSVPPEPPLSPAPPAPAPVFTPVAEYTPPSPAYAPGPSSIWIEPPAAAPSAIVERARAIGAGIVDGLRGFGAAGSEIMRGWFGGLKRGETALISLSLDAAPARPSAGDPDASPSGWTPVVPPPPLAPPVQPPPHFSELPALRLAPIAETPLEDEDVYDGEDIYHEPGFVHYTWVWTKRVVVISVLMVGAAAAAYTWESWLPRAGYLGRSVIGEVEKRTQMEPPAPSLAEKDRQALRAALDAAAGQLPHLAPETIQEVMSSSLVGLLEPPDVFRRAYEAAERGQPLLPTPEAEELTVLLEGMLSSLSPAERDRVRAYDLVRGARATLPYEDRDILEMFSRTTLALPTEQQERLRVLYGQAVVAGLGAR